MNKVPTFFLLLLLVTAIAIPPSEAFAKRGSDDSHHEQESRNDDSGHHDDDSDDDWDDDDDSDDDSNDDWDDDDSSTDDNDSSTNSTTTSSNLEVEADVFTDTTIVKVEQSGNKKVVFQTDADTKAEVVDAIVAKFNLNRADVEAVLDFEIENRASRVKERAEITSQSNSTANNENLRTQIAKLQELIELLLVLLAQQTATTS